MLHVNKFGSLVVWVVNVFPRHDDNQLGYQDGSLGVREMSSGPVTDGGPWDDRLEVRFSGIFHHPYSAGRFVPKQGDVFGRYSHLML